MEGPFGGFKRGKPKHQHSGVFRTPERRDKIMNNGKCIHCGHNTMIPTGCIRCGFPGTGEAITAIGYTNPAISASIHLRDLRRKRRDARSQASETRRNSIDSGATRDKNQKALFIAITVLFGLFFMAQAAGIF